MKLSQAQYDALIQYIETQIDYRIRKYEGRICNRAEEACEAETNLAELLLEGE